MVVVLSQAEAETLRTVTITIPRIADVELGRELTVCSGGTIEDPRPSIEVSTGKLLVETRADGAEIISSTDALRGVSLGGTLTIDEHTDEVLAGTFTVDLDDGGYLNGAFAALPSQ